MRSKKISQFQLCGWSDGWIDLLDVIDRFADGLERWSQVVQYWYHQYFKCSTWPRQTTVFLSFTLIYEWKQERIKRQKNAIKLTSWLQPFFGVEISFQHSLVEKHVTHRLRDDNVNLLRHVDFFNLAGNHDYFISQFVVADQSLNK